MLTDLLSHPIVAQLKALDAGVLKFCEKISPFQSDGFMFEIGPVCLNCWYEHENLDDKETTDFEVLNFDDDATEVQYVSSLFNDEFYTCESCNNLIYTDLRNLAYAAQLAAKLYEFSKSFTGDLDSLIDCTYCKKFGQLGAMTFPEKRAICTRCTDYDSLRRFTIYDFNEETQTCVAREEITLENFHEVEKVVAKEVCGLYDGLKKKFQAGVKPSKEELQRAISYMEWNNKLDSQRRYDETCSFHSDVILLQFILNNI